MHVLRFPDAPAPRWVSPVAALGNFDGVHRGHAKLLERVRRQALERGGTAVAVVFDPHPPRIVRPDKAPKLLMTLDQKIEAFERAGMQAVVVVTFTPAVAQWSPETFVETVLIDWLAVTEVWVGANFLFGHDRAGTFTLLRAIGEDRGFRVEKIDPVRYKDFVVSSTRIRRLVEEGRVDEAAALLGHQYAIEGRVIRGDGRGRTLAMPTANLETANELMPANGIYAAVAMVDGVQHPAVSSVGVRPTIGDGRFTVETHLLDGAIDLYDRRMTVAFIRWLRAEQRFDGLDALAAAMAADAAQARALFARMAL